MQGIQFRQWIEAGYRSYGKDPWFFLRELAQNSRDAGAATVRVRIHGEGSGEEILVFSDDGSGMSWEHAQKFLFRLYASSKADDRFSAGQYGIGFWTVLRFSPGRIIIESSTGDRDWAIELDAGLNFRKTPCGLKQRGTRVTLIRPAQSESPEDFTRTVREKLTYYCGFLRRNDRRSSPLPVYLQQELISREFRLPGIISTRFKKGMIEGAVGFSSKPRVTLYARGLPVWEGALLDELKHIASAGEQQSEIGQGLAPVFLLNGNNLDVNMSRKTIIENRALKQMLKTARGELENLIFRTAGAINHSNRFRLWGYRLRTAGKKWIRSFWLRLLLLLLLIVPVEIFILNTLFPSLGSRPGRATAPVNAFFQEKTEPFPGATVSRFSRPANLALAYQPPVSTWFGVFRAEQYHPKLGFIRARSGTVRFTPAVASEAEAMVIRLQIPGPGKLYLAVPEGRLPASDRVTTSSGLRIPIFQNTSGEHFVTLTDREGFVEYSCSTGKNPVILSPERRRKLTALPGSLRLPASLERELARAEALPAGEKIDLALKLTDDRFVYDRSSETARAWQRRRNDPDWIGKALQIGKGDCDTINGAAALFLRRMGMPARLVIGLTGENGRARNVLHAWVEYHHSGWHTLDASALVTPAVTNGGLSDTSGDPAPGEIENLPDAMPPAQSSRRGGPLWLFFLLSTAIILIPLLVILNRKKNRRREFSGENRAEIRRDLARIAMGSILHPGLWSSQDTIWEADIIPTLNGHPISLAKALRLSRQGRLLVGSTGCRLCQFYREQGLPVLDQQDTVFKPLIRLLPDSVNLDRIENLQAVDPENIEKNRLAGLMAEVNRCLPAIGKHLPPYRWCPGMSDGDLKAVRLARGNGISRVLLRLKGNPAGGRAAGLPESFLAANPRNAELRERLRLSEEHPLLARYRMIETSIRESGYLPGHQKRLLRRAASRLFLEMK